MEKDVPNEAGSLLQLFTTLSSGDGLYHTPEKAVPVGVSRIHGCCPVRATGGSLLPCGRYLLAPLAENTKGGKGVMVLRVKPTPTRFPTISLYTPMDNTPLHSIPSVCRPWGGCGGQWAYWLDLTG